jgi:hypothetical protein
MGGHEVLGLRATLQLVVEVPAAKEGLADQHAEVVPGLALRNLAVASADAVVVKTEAERV